MTACTLETAAAYLGDKGQIPSCLSQWCLREVARAVNDADTSNEHKHPRRT